MQRTKIRDYLLIQTYFVVVMFIGYAMLSINLYYGTIKYSNLGYNDFIGIALMGSGIGGQIGIIFRFMGRFKK